MKNREIISLIPKRIKKSHKGTYGRLLIIAGSDMYTGAVSLTVEAALRSGVGLVFVMTTQEAAQVVRTRSPEAIVMVGDSVNGCLDAQSIAPIIQAIDSHRINACCIGPGLGKLSLPRPFYDGLVKEIVTRQLPTLVDADALVDIYDLATTMKFPKDLMVFTPHPKEFQAMTNGTQLMVNVADIKAWANKVQQVICYKTEKTLVSDGTRSWETTTGNESLATAGSGDVLSGIISGFLAQKLAVYDAARLGVFLHGFTAELMSKKLGVRALLARDLCNGISDSFLELLSTHE